MLANVISKSYVENIVFVCVLSGAAVFMADLIRELAFDCELDFIRISSYEGTHSTGKVNFTLNLKSDIKGKHVVIVEDILDTGLTLLELQKTIKSLEPASLEVCVFCRKPKCLKYDVKPKYIGMDL
jgi:hypoxanthine phosphoribosyltransferase